MERWTEVVRSTALSEVHLRFTGLGLSMLPEESFLAVQLWTTGLPNVRPLPQLHCSNGFQPRAPMDGACATSPLKLP